MDAFRNPRTPYPAPGPPRPKTPPKPKAPKISAPKPLDPNAQASQNAMSAFRTALAQLNATTPAVDANAIRAPYAASEQITGQLGAGFQQATNAAGQQAQQQYAQARDAAQQHAAQFGISAGAGANPTALTDNGTAALAQQGAAYSAAAPAATAQWQALLERTAGAKVGEAQVARDAGLTSARQSLATSLPGAIQNEKQLGFQEQTQRDNMGLARSQLTAKQISDLQQYELGAAKVNQSGQVAQTKAQQSAASIAERRRHDLATETAANKKLSQGDQALQIKRRASTASAKGLKGVPAAVKALSGSTGTGTKPVTGYKVTYVADGNGVNAGAPPVSLFVKDPKSAKPPAGYLPNTTGQPVYGQAGKTTQGVTPAAWDAQMRSLLAQNPGQGAAIKAFLGPRPKAAKKK